MTIASLHKAVCERMKQIVSAFWRLEQREGTAAPAVFAHELPAKQAGGEQFPYILVQALDGADNYRGRVSDSNDSRVTVRMVIGTRADEHEGAADLLLLIDAIRYDLLVQPVLGEVFECIAPITWSIPQELNAQKWPYWYGEITTTWRIPQPRRIANRDPAPLGV